MAVRRVLVLIQVAALSRRHDKHTPARTNKLQENERKSNASFAADPLGESTQFFFDIQKFSFYALNRNCYFPNRECVRFFHFHVQREYSTVFYFVLRTFVWRFLAFYPFACGNTLQRFLHVFLGCFCTLSILQPFFLFF